MRKMLRNLTMLLTLGLALTACKEAVKALALVEVPRESVCMNNNYFMGGPQQTPVPLAGKTYWVCCEGCKQTMTKHTKERSAKDPVSGNTVDKALAFIGKLPNNNILYFESQANLQAYVVPTPTPAPAE